MAAITDFIRKLIRDTEASSALRDVQDDEIEDMIRSSTTVVDKAQLEVRYTHENKIFLSEFGHRFFVDGIKEVENGATDITFATKVFNLVEGEYEVVSSATYTIDPITGVVYFATEKTDAEADTLYTTYAYVDPYYVAAELLQNVANEYARMSFEAQSSTFKLRYDKIVDSLLRAADHLQGRSGLQVGTLNRGDRVDG